MNRCVIKIDSKITINLTCTKKGKLFVAFLKSRQDRKTLYRIEKGVPKVTLGAYFNVLRELGLQDDFLKLAVYDEFGRKLQDLKLLGEK